MKKHISLGDVGYRHPDHPYYTFGSRESAERHCENHGGDKRHVVLIDTRPTVEHVCEQIGEMENEACGIESEYNPAGPWDEYLKPSSKCIRTTIKWPERYRWLAVYVVTGGSEGLYLHIDAVLDDKRELLILGKSLSHSWMDCWDSAGRIAKYLSA